MASEIAAAREAWGAGIHRDYEGLLAKAFAASDHRAKVLETQLAELTAELQGLREIATSGPSTASGPSPLSHRVRRDTSARDIPIQQLLAADASRADAVAGLVDVVEGLLIEHDRGALPLHRVIESLRAALERVRKDLE